jgi:hypothetical protein
MKKGYLQIFIFISIGIIILFLISRISVTRNDEKLEQIARVIYQNEKHRFKETDKWEDFILLPYKENESGNGIVFTWIYILDTGDTAMANIELSRTKRLLNDEKPISIYFNYKHSYIFKTDKDLINLLPKKYKHDSSYINKLILSEYQEEFFDTINILSFIIEPNRLYHYLNEGFYSVLARNDNYTSIAFYEPIANLLIDNKIEPTMTAMIIFDNNSNVLIKPYQATDAEWSNYNKE